MQPSYEPDNERLLDHFAYFIDKKTENYGVIDPKSQSKLLEV